MALIEVSELTKYYGKYMSIESVGFAVEKGEIFGVIGEEDAGKTTVLDILCGAVKPSSGSVSVCGLDVQKDAGRVSSMIRVVSQKGESYAKIRAKTIDKYLSGILQEGMRQRAGRWCEQLGLSSDDVIRKMSKQKKTALYLIHSLIAMPRVLLLDDPFADADDEFVTRVSQILQNETKRGLTVVITAREEAKLLPICTSIARMHEGRMTGVEKKGAPQVGRSEASARNIGASQREDTFAQSMRMPRMQEDAFAQSMRMPRMQEDAFTQSMSAPRMQEDVFGRGMRMQDDAFARDRRDEAPEWNAHRRTQPPFDAYAQDDAEAFAQDDVRARRRQENAFYRPERSFFHEERSDRSEYGASAMRETPPQEERSYPRYGATFGGAFDGYDGRDERDEQERRMDLPYDDALRLQDRREEEPSYRRREMPSIESRMTRETPAFEPRMTRETSSFTSAPFAHRQEHEPQRFEQRAYGSSRFEQERRTQETSGFSQQDRVYEPQRFEQQTEYESSASARSRQEYGSQDRTAREARHGYSAYRGDEPSRERASSMHADYAAKESFERRSDAQPHEHGESPRHARHARREDYPLYTQDAPQDVQGTVYTPTLQPNRRVTLVADELPIPFLRSLGATGIHRDGDQIEFFFNDKIDALIIALSQMHVRDLRISVDMPVNEQTYR